MALTTAEREGIIKLVVGMFNASPGATYLSDLTVAYEANGRSLAQLARSLSDTSAFKAINPVLQTATEFAEKLLAPLGLNHDATALLFVMAKFYAGLSKGQIAYDVLTALDATTDPVFADARALVNHKVEVAEYFTVTKALNTTDMARLQASVATVTADPASVVTAEKAIDADTYYTVPAPGDGTTTPPGTTPTVPPTTGGPSSLGGGDSSPGGGGGDPSAGGGSVPPQGGDSSPGGGGDSSSLPWSDSESMGPPPPPPPPEDPMSPMGLLNPGGHAGVALVGMASAETLGFFDPAA